MKILCVIDNLGSGGAQRQLVTLAKELKNRGNEVDFFTFFPQNFFENTLKESGINVINEPKKDKLGLKVILKLAKVLNIGKYDIGISYLKTPNIFLALAAKISRSDVKIITSERTSTNLDNSALINRIRGMCHLTADAVVFNSYHERSNWVNRYPKLKDKSSTIYNGVDTLLFQPSILEFRKTYSLVGVGTLGPDKNIHIFIDAISKLKAEGLLVNVDWYGKYVTTEPRYNSYYKSLYKMVIDLDLTEQWNWFPPNKDINLILSKYDALVLPSILEGLPNVACEAMSCSLPIFLADLLDNPVLTGNSLRGFLFRPGEADDLALKIKTFYSLDEMQIAEIKANCREYALTHLSLENFYNNYNTLLKNL